MGRIDLLIVPDQGAADLVRAALTEAGIPVDVQRHYAEHPYQVFPLAEPWRIQVPEDRLQEAQQILARLEHEMAEEVEAQAMAAEPVTGAGRRRDS
jgi:hypothetical protein